jgi:hypothetical protein
VKKNQNNKSKYLLKNDGTFVIENFNHSKPFSNFFPGIAGVWGTPMWVFYVNRGQCISSVGVESKDKAIMEFQPANKAYRLTSIQGFRTFIKVKESARAATRFWEPFQNNLTGTDYAKNVRMEICAHDLTLREENKDLGLGISVNYFTLPEEDYAALVRTVTIKNNSRKTKTLQVIDGIPVVAPYGLKDWLNKHISRTVEAWAKVRNLENKAPYYQLNVEVSDKPEVTHIREGNFYFAFDPDSRKPKLFDPIIEAAGVFGETTDYLAPEKFFEDRFSIPRNQQFSNRSPSAMSHAAISLKPGEEKRIVSFLGFAHSIEQVNEIVKQALAKDFIASKARRNKEIIDEIKDYAFTASSSPALNLYSGHTFLDNILRGGLPISLSTERGKVAFNVFSRKHGDLERDYNFFTVAPTYFSQGNGNYRDVNQNRRCDVLFNTDVKESHIVTFFNLVQADGYNPLVVKGTSFVVHDKNKADQILAVFIEGQHHSQLRKFFEKAFQPGELLNFISREDIRLKNTAKSADLKGELKGFLAAVLETSQKQEMADHGEGFWSDHWTYNLDLIESFIAIYPDLWKDLLLNKKEFTFYHNSHYVLPRDERYIITPKGVRQYEAVHNGVKETQAQLHDHKLCVKDTNGQLYQTTLIAKILCLIANKSATLDPSGIGIEMEADKPNWYDALNGLPGLSGSSVSETFEVKRLAQFLWTQLDALKLGDGETILVFAELAVFLDELVKVLENSSEPLAYWNGANAAKEAYRLKIRREIDGKENGVSVGYLKRFLKLVIDRMEIGVRSAVDSKRFLATYFYHEVIEHIPSTKDGHGKHTYVTPKKFKRHTLPLFLEGYVHALRAETSEVQTKKIYQQVRKSGLYDRELKMYKVNDSLQAESEDIGRTRVFPSGWLENESIWLHMEYKFMLELLRKGLHEEFYENFKNVLIPFLKPERYGRNILENSSFIASSAHEDQKIHGQGFVARLSGSTAEFLHMWLLMNAGEKPFSVNEKGELEFRLDPILTGDLFSSKKANIRYLNAQKEWKTIELPAQSYAFKFLGKTLVVYHNPKKKNTFGPKKAEIQEYQLHYSESKTHTVQGNTISMPQALAIRDGEVVRIDVYLW